MDGLLVIDKPAGPTSHDVVQRMRRLLKEKSIGHTGTLDPMATGVLALVLGRATRLAKFLSASDKSYDAVVTLGVATDTYDADGEPVGPKHHGPLPSRRAIEDALDAFRGTFLQQPPAYSAKKIGGERSYRLAREAKRAAAPMAAGVAPVSVTTTVVELLALDGEDVTLRVDCSAGFYVRSLAHDLGQALGTGAHLSALRRTRAGEFTLAGALSLTPGPADQDPDEAVGFVIPLGQVLTRFPSVVLSAEGVIRASHGRNLAPSHMEPPCGTSAPGTSAPGTSTQHPAPSTRHPFVRLLDRDGGLVGIAEPGEAPGFLHPSIVLM
jgi:tRNA pseudouridine55 synthase